MRMRTTAGFAIGALALVSAAPAMAQDSTYDDSWTGFYVGGSFGFGAQSNNGGETLQFDTNLDGNFGDTVNTAAGANAFSPGFCRGQARGATPAGTCRSNKDGIEYFARAGYDQQMGNFVVGVMGEFGKANIRDSVSGFSTTPANYVYNREFDWQASIRGRAGYATNGALFYVAGGPAYARIDHTFTSTNTANSFTTTGDRNAWGVTGGGGVEIKATSNIAFGLEYMYSRYYDDDSRVAVGAGTAPTTNPFRIVNPNGTDIRRSDDRFDYHGLRATAAFRF
jgi:outer membrane immunogenic protein